MLKNAKLPTGKRRQKSRQPKKYPQNSAKVEMDGKTEQNLIRRER
jgi:hypothetical protein